MPMKMLRCGPLWAALAMALAVTPVMAATNTWSGATAGDWTDTTRWSLADYPGNTDRTDDDVVVPNNITPTITLTQAMFPGGLTIRSFASNLTNSGGAAAVLNASGTALDRLSITVGDEDATLVNAMRISNRFKFNMTNVDLAIVGTADGNSSSLLYLNGNNFTPEVPNLTAVNSTISILDAGTPDLGNNQRLGLWVGGNDRTGATMVMIDSELTVTNAGGNAAIMIGAQGQTGDDRVPSSLTLTDTVLAANIVAVNHGGQLIFNGTDAPQASSVSNRLRFGNAGYMTFEGGTINANQVAWEIGRIASWADRPLAFQVTGGEVNVATLMSLNRAGAMVHVSAGLLTVSAIDVFAGLGTYDDFAGDGVNVSGGQLEVAGLIRLGRQVNPINGPDGRLSITGGTLKAGQIDIGAQNGDGYYEQLGGQAEVGSVRIGLTGPDGRTRGGRALTVDQGAVLTLTGAGLVLYDHGGIGGRALLLDAADWQVAGTIAFAPGLSVTSQQLVALGQDLGEDMAGYANNYAIGTLDLTALVLADAVLAVTAASAQASNMDGPNAIYVQSLLMGLGDISTAGDYFSGDVNIYYNPSYSDITGNWAFSDASGGWLIMIPEPGTVLLMAAGGVLLLTRRSRNRFFTPVS